MVSKEQVEGINDFGYDQFLGREIFEDGDENFVRLDLHRGGSCAYSSLEQSCGDLCRWVKNGEKVLLYQSPGKIGPRTMQASQLFEALESVLGAKMEEGDAAMIIGGGNEETYILCGRKYLPFKSDQMVLLEVMYQNELGMEEFPNPFDNQPKIS